MKHSKHWITSAHRGFVDDTLAQNTLAAYYNAFLNGADMIETDARFSADGVLIVNHDPTVTAKNAFGEAVTLTVAQAAAADICALTLSDDPKWGRQYVPTIEQVLKLAYHTGLTVNIDLKNGIEAAAATAKLVLRCGMQGKVVYALNGCGMDGINEIIAIDPDARFIGGGRKFAETVRNYPRRGNRCFCYCNTNTVTADTVDFIRESGCLLALISLDPANFEKAMEYSPDMCEFLHTSDFKTIEQTYLQKIKLY